MFEERVQKQKEQKGEAGALLRAACVCVCSDAAAAHVIVGIAVTLCEGSFDFACTHCTSSSFIINIINIVDAGKRMVVFWLFLMGHQCGF
jgi:hypothetical protein